MSCLFARVTLLALVLFLARPGVPAPGPTVLTAEQWQRDLRFLAAEIPKMHREPFHKVVSREQFDKAVAELDARIPSLADHKVVVELARIVAMLGDGHTQLALPQGGRLAFHRLPIQLGVFSEGLFVRAATEEHRNLIGARVVEVGREPAGAALEAVRGIAHYDNEMGFQQVAPFLLAIPEVLHAVGLAESPERARLVVEVPGGQRREVILAPLSYHPRLIEAREVAKAPVPLWERDPETNYWFEVLRPSRTLYVQFNEVAHIPGEPLQAFVARIEKTLADPGIDRLVLDLRHNPGGNGYLNRSLVLALVRNEKINRFGRFFTLIGRETFSAAQLLTNDLELLTNTLFVGEPTGSSPSAYGDARWSQLPESGLAVRISSVYWRDWSDDEKRKWTPPDLPVELRAADYFANRDAVLEAALQYQPRNMEELLADVALAGGIDSAWKIVYRYASDPRNAGASTEPMMNAAGLALLGKGKPKEAGDWFEIMLRDHPESARAHLGLGRALLAAGDKGRARQAIEEALRLEPENAAAKELLRTVL